MGIWYGTAETFEPKVQGTASVYQTVNATSVLEKQRGVAAYQLHQ